jgi:hypothetical protein
MPEIASLACRKARVACLFQYLLQFVLSFINGFLLLRDIVTPKWKKDEVAKFEKYVF